MHTRLLKKKNVKRQKKLRHIRRERRGKKPRN